MDWPRVPIADDFLPFAKRVVQFSIPEKRTGGFAETEGQERGNGDLCDLLGTLTIYEILAALGVTVTLELSANGGDQFDFAVTVGGKRSTWNVKTSRYAPVRDGLNLCVKEEELAKGIPVGGYVQVFVHLDETDDPEPHVHIAGVCKRAKVSDQPVRPLPGHGHPGHAVPCESLASWADFVDWAAR